MPINSGGILLYREVDGRREVLLVHPGGPFWFKKDLGAWSIPKGEVSESEDALAAARREFHEETGGDANGSAIPLGTIRQRSGKVVHAWAVRGNFDVERLLSNRFEIEWPRGSGTIKSFPEVDRAEWFDLLEARRRLLAGQCQFLDRLERELDKIESSSPKPTS